MLDCEGRKLIDSLWTLFLCRPKKRPTLSELLKRSLSSFGLFSQSMLTDRHSWGHSDKAFHALLTDLSFSLQSTDMIPYWASHLLHVSRQSRPSGQEAYSHHHLASVCMSIHIRVQRPNPTAFSLVIRRYRVSGKQGSNCRIACLLKAWSALARSIDCKVVHIISLLPFALEQYDFINDSCKEHLSRFRGRACCCHTLVANKSDIIVYGWTARHAPQDCLRHLRTAQCLTSSPRTEGVIISCTSNVPHLAGWGWVRASWQHAWLENIVQLPALTSCLYNKQSEATNAVASTLHADKYYSNESGSYLSWAVSCWNI